MEEEEVKIKKIITTIEKETLNLNENKIKNLKETFNSETKLIEEDNEDKISFLLKKKDLTIVLYQEEKTDKNKNVIEEKTIMYRGIQSLTNLLETIFQIKITSYKEPILLIGPPTCYKTFVANIILENATIVSLNRESTVLQLLGSPFFFSKDEHKAFCITQIYSILGLANVKAKLNWEKVYLLLKMEKNMKEI